MYMNFIDWMARTSRKKKKKTYSDYWKLLCICFSLLAQRQMTGNVLEQMRRVQPTVFCSGIVVANRWFSVKVVRHKNREFLCGRLWKKNAGLVPSSWNGSVPGFAHRIKTPSVSAMEILQQHFLRPGHFVTVG